MFQRLSDDLCNLTSLMAVGEAADGIRVREIPHLPLEGLAKQDKDFVDSGPSDISCAGLGDDFLSLVSPSDSDDRLAGGQVFKELARYDRRLSPC